MKKKISLILLILFLIGCSSNKEGDFEFSVNNANFTDFKDTTSLIKNNDNKDIINGYGILDNNYVKETETKYDNFDRYTFEDGKTVYIEYDEKNKYSYNINIYLQIKGDIRKVNSIENSLGIVGIPAIDDENNIYLSLAKDKDDEFDICKVSNRKKEIIDKSRVAVNLSYSDNKLFYTNVIVDENDKRLPKIFDLNTKKQEEFIKDYSGEIIYSSTYSNNKIYLLNGSDSNSYIDVFDESGKKVQTITIKDADFENLNEESDIISDRESIYTDIIIDKDNIAILGVHTLYCNVATKECSLFADNTSLYYYGDGYAEGVSDSGEIYLLDMKEKTKQKLMKYNPGIVGYYHNNRLEYEVAKSEDDLYENKYVKITYTINER